MFGLFGPRYVTPNSGHIFFSSLSTTFCQGTEQTLAAQLAAAEANQILDGVGGGSKGGFLGCEMIGFLGLSMGSLNHFAYGWLVQCRSPCSLLQTQRRKSPRWSLRLFTIREQDPSQIERK